MNNTKKSQSFSVQLKTKALYFYIHLFLRIHCKAAIWNSHEKSTWDGVRNGVTVWAGVCLAGICKCWCSFILLFVKFLNSSSSTVYQFLPGFAFSWLLDKQLLQEISHPNRLMALLTDISAGHIVSPLLSYRDTAKCLLAFTSMPWALSFALFL